MIIIVNHINNLKIRILIRPIAKIRIVFIIKIGVCTILKHIEPLVDHLLQDVGHIVATCLLALFEHPVCRIDLKQKLATRCSRIVVRHGLDQFSSRVIGTFLNSFPFWIWASKSLRSSIIGFGWPTAFLDPSPFLAGEMTSAPSSEVVKSLY